MTQLSSACCLCRRLIRFQGQNRTTRNTTNLRTSAQFLETELTEDRSIQNRSFIVCRPKLHKSMLFT